MKHVVHGAVGLIKYHLDDCVSVDDHPVYGVQEAHVLDVDGDLGRARVYADIDELFLDDREGALVAVHGVLHDTVEGPARVGEFDDVLSVLFIEGADKDGVLVVIGVQQEQIWHFLFFSFFFLFFLFLKKTEIEKEKKMKKDIDVNYDLWGINQWNSSNSSDNEEATDDVRGLYVCSLCLGAPALLAVFGVVRWIRLTTLASLDTSGRRGEGCSVPEEPGSDTMGLL